MATERVGLDPEGRVAFKQGRPSALPFPDGFFDLVAQVDGRPATAELARVLAPGGYLVLARTRPARTLFGLGGEPPRRRLARHGIELLEAAESGEGSFAVARRSGAGPSGNDE